METFKEHAWNLCLRRGLHLCDLFIQATTGFAFWLHASMNVSNTTSFSVPVEYGHVIHFCPQLLQFQSLFSTSFDVNGFMVLPPLSVRKEEIGQDAWPVSLKVASWRCSPSIRNSLRPLRRRTEFFRSGGWDTDGKGHRAGAMPVSELPLVPRTKLGLKVHPTS